MNNADNTLFYRQPAKCFNEALPLGNGRIGAMVYGGVESETVRLNEDTLWSGYPKPINEGNYPEIYKEAVSIFENGEKKKAQALLEQNFGDRLVQAYLPLAEMQIKTGHTDYTDYERRLELETGIHTVSYRIGEEQFTRETFISPAAQVMAMRFKSNTAESISFEVSLKSNFKCTYKKKLLAFLMCGVAPEYIAEKGKAYNKDTAVFGENGVSFACGVTVNTMGGKIKCTPDLIKVKNADEAVIYFSARTNFEDFKTVPFDKKGYITECLSEVKRAYRANYEELKQQSIAKHKGLYSLCDIHIESENVPNIPTDERIKDFKENCGDNSPYNLIFNYAKYLMISGSRKGTQPLNLQGIWNDKVLPPWSSNYTLNINTEMNYWPALSMGLFDCFEPFIRFVEELAVTGSKTAKLYYNAEGWVCHHSSDLWRLSHPGTNLIENNAQWGFWNMASGWLSVMLWNYYRYTLDLDYLKRIYPVIDGAARFYKQLLSEDNGELILSPTTSPENNYIENGEVTALDKSTAMTQEILFDLFSAVGEAQEILGLNNDYKEVISKLKRPQIQSNGELCEWHSEHGVWDIYHRHISHLYGLFPSNQLGTEEKAAAERVLEARGDGGTGWSLAWKINLWARLKDGERALKLLDNQLTYVSPDCDTPDRAGGTYPNMFCAHPPFQIDGNFGAASGIIEMLVQTDENGNPILLPALPEKWKNGKVRNLRLPENRSISFIWENGKVIWSEIVERKE